jgi:3-hydroxybutyrate dehydrogenase
MTVRDKAILITGAGSGIGKTLAYRFYASGSSVVFADINFDAATAAAQDVADPDRAFALQMDVTDEASVKNGVETICTRLGKLDVLISNAGLQHISAIVDLELTDWKRLLAVHLDWAFLTTRECMRRMINAGTGGTIIYMGSVHSHLASPLKAPYVTAKHGLLGLARAVAEEGAAHGIRSNVVCPGFIRTPLVDAQIGPQARALKISEAEVIRNVMLKDTVDGEFTTTADVAETALFLAGFPTLALSGQSIVVSHGWHMN